MCPSLCNRELQTLTFSKETSKVSLLWKQAGLPGAVTGLELAQKRALSAPGGLLFHTPALRWGRLRSVLMSPGRKTLMTLLVIDSPLVPRLPSSQTERAKWLWTPGMGEKPPSLLA